MPVTLEDALFALASGEMAKREFDLWMRTRLSELRQTRDVSREQRLLSELELLSLESDEGIRPPDEFYAAARRIALESPL